MWEPALPAHREEEDEEVDSLEIKGDAFHQQPEAQVRVNPKQASLHNDEILSVVYPHKLPATHKFVSALRNAYIKDYELNFFLLGSQPLQWAGRFKFIHP